ncbi:MAG: hypothetical protein ABI112_15065 [Terracoccus sp.]
MSPWLINISLPRDIVVPLFDGISDAVRFPVPDGLGLRFAEEERIRVRDADPDEGTNIFVYDWAEQLGWRIYDFLAELTTANMWMMDEGGLLLTARGLTAEEVGLDLAVDRVPTTVLIRDDQGMVRQWRPEPNPRSGTLT